jgi:hypothetical protein
MVLLSVEVWPSCVATLMESLADNDEGQHKRSLQAFQMLLSLLDQRTLLCARRGEAFSTKLNQSSELAQGASRLLLFE